MPLPDQFRAELTRELAAGSLISEPAQLRTYECDALTGHRAVPELVVIPGSVAEVQAVVAALPRPRRALRRSRRRHGALGRRAAGRRRGRDLARAAQPRPRGRPRARPGRRRARRDEPRDHEGRRRRGLLLRTRSLEPAGLHDRRQRRRELGRRALPQARVHGQPRARGRRRPRGRRARHALPRRRRAPTCSACSSAPRGRSGSPSRITVRVLRVPETRADAARRVREHRRGGRRRLARDRRRDPAGRDRDDGRADDRGGRGGGRARVSRRRGRRADRRARRAGGARSPRSRPPSRRSAGESGAFELHAAETRRGACADLARPQVGVRRDGPDLVQLLRPGRRRAADEAARGAARAPPSSRPSTGCGSRASSTPATATCIPLVLYDERGRGRAGARRAARDGDPRPLHRRGRVADRRARDRRRQGVLDAEALRRARPRGDAPAPRRASTRPASQIRARCSRPRDSAARCRAPTAPTRSSGPGLPNVSEPATLAEAAGAARRGRARLDRAGWGRGRALDRAAEPAARARAGRPDRDRRGGDAALGAAGLPGRVRPDARARPARRPDDRRLPRRRPLRAAPPPLRRRCATS